MNEADTRAKLIDPALRAAGWTENLIRREVTAAPVEIVGGGAGRLGHGRADYTLRVQVAPGTQPVAVALIEAKAEGYPPTRGLEQAKRYAASGERLNVPFVYSSNGHRFVEYDASTGLTAVARPMGEFPSPEDLRARYEAAKNFALDAESAKPLRTPYRGGEAQRRYYQDAAIRATLERSAASGNRALLSMATGSGKTFVAVNLLRKIADAGQLRRALFLCDRDELRAQALAALRGAFGADAAAAEGGDPQKNARIIVATYQTLGVDGDNPDSTFLRENYPHDYFSHIVIDEAHRSAWGKWSEVLERNPRAFQIGLTATPRELPNENTEDSRRDAEITADNLKYFGEPVYHYSIGQGIEDGYLARMEIRKRDIFLNRHLETEKITGVSKADMEGKALMDALTGAAVSVEEARELYEARSFETSLMIPDRVSEMCEDLFGQLIETGGPAQKTIIFCARDRHADDVAIGMNNLYAEWARANGETPASDYAFKCTAETKGAGLAELRGSATHHFIATTVDLLGTGVDVPRVVNVVFFRYVSSPISFHQMIGRGTRLHPESGKMMFRVYDYTNAARLLVGDFASKPSTGRGGKGGDPPDGTERPIEVEGMDVRITAAGTYIYTTDESGEEVALTLEEYRERLAAKLVADVPTLEDFREAWADPEPRREMVSRLPDAGRSPSVIRHLTGMDDCDLFDVLADIGYGQAPKTRAERAAAFEYKNRDWLDWMPERASGAILAIASQFALGGTETLENRYIFRTPAVADAGGINALREYAAPREALTETKRRMFRA